MIDFSDFSSEVFQILRAYGKDIVLYDETGKRVFEPTEARRMYVIGDNILVSIVEDGDNSSVKMFLSPSLNLTQVQGFLETLRRLAVQSNLLFHVKKYNKEIKPKDFATQASVNEQKEIQMNIMEGLYGTSKSSYLKLENARMIVRHSTRIKEHVIGDRGRHIHSIFVENAQGERFLFPVNMLSGARAMTQHVNKGGNFADEVGSQIVRMAQDFRNLAQVTNHINNLPGLQEAQKNNEKVEAYGVKGMKSTPWRKVFKNLDALNAWCEKNDAEVHAYSEVEQDKTHESAVALRTAIMESMRGTKRSFSRIYTESTYLGESQRVASNQNLLEGSESLSESVSALAAILGEGVSDEALLSVARNVTIEAATAPQLDEEVDGDVEEFDEDEDLEGDDEMEEGHQIDVTVEGAFTDTPNNPQIREFESWLESFDPDAMFGGEKKTNEALDGRGAYNKGAMDARAGKPRNNPYEKWETVSYNLYNTGYKDNKEKTPRAPKATKAVKEGEATQWEVHGTIGLNNKFVKKFDSEDARQQWLDKYEDSGKFEVTELVDPSHAMTESPSNHNFYVVQADDMFYKCADPTVAQTVANALKANGAEDVYSMPASEQPEAFADEIAENAELINARTIKQLMADSGMEHDEAYLGMLLSDNYEYELGGMNESVMSNVNESEIMGYDTNWLMMILFAEHIRRGLGEGAGFNSYAEDDDNQWEANKFFVELNSKATDKSMLPDTGKMEQTIRPIAAKIAAKLGITVTGLSVYDWHSWQNDYHESGMTITWSGQPNPDAVAAMSRGLDISYLADYFGIEGNFDESMMEGKSFKRNDDEGNVKAKRKEDKQKRDQKKTPVEEGKSFKRNDDDETDVKAKRKEEKEKRDAKKQPIDEAAEKKFYVYHKVKADRAGGPDYELLKTFNADEEQEARAFAAAEKKKLKTQSMHSVVVRTTKVVEESVNEGKSFKRNADDEADAKKKQDKERKDSAKNKRNVKESAFVSESSVQGMDVNWLVMVLFAEFGGRGLDLYGDYYMFAEDDDNEWSPGKAVIEIGTKQKDLASLRSTGEMTQFFRPRIEAVASKLGISITSFEISDWHSYQSDLHEAGMWVKWTGTPNPQALQSLADQIDIDGLAEYFDIQGGMDESMVDEDASQFSGSFETNINTEDGQTVSAKVTYVPNEAGAATILSVVRGDTGEDVLPFMDDDDIIHVEGLCADDIAQQGTPQFSEDTTIPRNPHDDFKNDVMTGGKHGEEQDPGYIARMKALAGLK